MDLTLLIKEINYQESYDYDKRCNLFNKYKIPVSQKFFNPIMELASFVTYMNISSRGIVFGYSHSGNIASNFNKSLKNPENKTLVHLENDYIQVTDKRIRLQHSYWEENKMKWKTFFTFDLFNKTVKIENSCTISRTLYQDIDQFLIDLGYEAW